MLTDSLEDAVEITNGYAPEHLELNVKAPEVLKDQLYNYGSLFVGEKHSGSFRRLCFRYQPYPSYASGCRYTGGVWVGTFLKTCTHQSMTPKAMKELAPLVERMAQGEGLMGHAQAAKVRREK